MKSIEGENLILKQVEEKDAEYISKWFSDKEQNKYMSTFVRTRDHPIEKIREEIINSNENFERLFMIYLKGYCNPIGHCGIDDLDLHDKRGEIFFIIGEKEFQGKGYGKETAKLLLKLGFEKLGLNTLFATATLENVSSIKTLEKVGFKYIGIRREYNFINDKYLDEILFDITRKDYEKNE